MCRIISGYQSIISSEDMLLLINQRPTNQSNIHNSRASLFKDNNDKGKDTVGPELKHDISTDGPASDTGIE